MEIRPNLASLSPGLSIVETPHLTETRMLVLSRWGRFRAWIERLADLADFSRPMTAASAERYWKALHSAERRGA